MNASMLLYKYVSLYCSNVTLNVLWRLWCLPLNLKHNIPMHFIKVLIQDDLSSKFITGNGVTFTESAVFQWLISPSCQKENFHPRPTTEILCGGWSWSWSECISGSVFQELILFPSILWDVVRFILELVLILQSGIPENQRNMARWIGVVVKAFIGFGLQSMVRCFCETVPQVWTVNKHALCCLWRNYTNPEFYKMSLL